VSQLWILAVEQSSLLMRIRRRTLNVMTTKFLALISVIGLATISVVQAQLAAPGSFSSRLHNETLSIAAMGVCNSPSWRNRRLAVSILQ